MGRSLSEMPVALMMVNLVGRTPESIISFGFFHIFYAFGLIFAIFYICTAYFSV